MDYVKCDGCGEYLDMNRAVHDRTARYNISDKDIIKHPKYVEVTKYPDEKHPEHLYYCSECAKTWFEAVFSRHSYFRYDLKICTGMVIVPEIDVIEAELSAADGSQETSDAIKHAEV